MPCLLQICSTFAFLYWIGTSQSAPLFQGFSIQKGLEVNFKPFQFKPLSFFKEKWSPFGRFGVRKGIQKRDLGANMDTKTDGERRSPRSAAISPAPVVEYLDESSLIEENSFNEVLSKELQSGPDPVKPLSSNLIRVPLTESVKPPAEGFYTSIGRNPPANVTPKPLNTVIEEVYGELPPRPVGPIPEPAEESVTSVTLRPVTPFPLRPIGSVQPITPIPVQPISPFEPVNPVQQIRSLSILPVNAIGPNSFRPVSPIPLRPDILSLGQVQPSVPQVIPLITPPPPVSVNPNVLISEIPPTEGPLVRGSKLALYFGNVLLQLVSQFLTNARMQFSQISKQSPLPQIPLPASINN